MNGESKVFDARRAACGRVPVGLAASAVLALLLVLLGACSLPAQEDNQGEPSSDEMGRQENVAEFVESPAEVIGALVTALVQRGELKESVAAAMRESAVASIQSQQQAQLSSDSKEIGADELKSLAKTESQRYVTERGGRYVVNFVAEPLGAGGTRLTVSPTLVAFVRGMDGPLGGRPLPSNGTLERTLLMAVRQALQDR